MNEATRHSLRRLPSRGVAILIADLNATGPQTAEWYTAISFFRSDYCIQTCGSGIRRIGKWRHDVVGNSRPPPVISQHDASLKSSLPHMIAN